MRPVETTMAAAEMMAMGIMPTVAVVAVERQLRC